MKKPIVNSKEYVNSTLKIMRSVRLWHAKSVVEDGGVMRRGDLIIDLAAKGSEATKWKIYCVVIDEEVIAVGGNVISRHIKTDVKKYQNLAGNRAGLAFGRKFVNEKEARTLVADLRLLKEKTIFVDEIGDVKTKKIVVNNKSAVADVVKQYDVEVRNLKFIIRAGVSIAFYALLLSILALSIYGFKREICRV